ncbi:MAG: ethylbenzene dehydrogenase-related protein [Pseudomonadota bacterium]|nr:ethylbenzene dehydrogenase-related protein [Pseudomonadota bacterium]
MACGPEPAALIREENSARYDPDAGWKEGDVLPGRLLSRVDARGSAADNTRVTGKWEDGSWIVTWIRPLDTGHDDDITLKRSNTYTFGFAVHDDNVTTRFHFVSFPVVVGIGRGGDITAGRQEPVAPCL